MIFTVPHPAEGSPKEGDEIAWRRELKQLRVRVVQLEAERGIRQPPSVDVKRDGQHGLWCGSPCGVVVLDRRPRVECAQCGGELNAIEVLRDYAKHERNFCYSLEHLRKEKRELTAEVEKLKKLRLRLRAEARKLLPEPRAVRGMDRKWDRDLVANMHLDHVLAREPDDTP